ncbi:MAG TPA: ATP-binding protein [Polyangiaceae bacterium]|nr:ATP-binding protein [Polyangiaceae bacterium]
MRANAACERCATAERNAGRVESALRGAGKWFRKLRFDGEGDEDVSKVVRAPEAFALGKTHYAAARLVLRGETGVGKTSLAVAMLRARIEKSGEVAAFISCRELAIARAKFEESDPRLVSRALSCDVLVLDDLANGRDIPSSPIEDIIAERHKNGSATWVTTYRDYKALAGLMGGDIARRVYERAFIIDCNPRKGAEACPDS